VVALEDADRPLSPQAERAAFHLLNLAAAEGASVLVTGCAPPARWPIRLPDLASRLAILPLARLSAPDDALLAAVIAKQLDDRRLAYDPALPGWLATRIERSFAAARAAVERLDARSLAERRNLTRRFAAEIFP
jgi:chromosomal replication initiation ATPase DnaA